MQKVLEKIKIGLEKQQISNRKMAKFTKVSHTTINKVVSGENTPDFILFIKMVQLAYPDDLELQRNYIKEYCRKTSPVNTRLAFEFLNVYGDLDLLKELLGSSVAFFETLKREKKRLSKTLQINKQLTDLYLLLDKRSEGRVSRQDYYAAVKTFINTQKITSTEVHIVSEFALIYAFSDSFDFKVIRDHAERLLPYIQEISNTSLRSSYRLRTQEILATCCQRDNKLKEAREILIEIINDQDNHYPGMKAGAYCVLGETYAFEDYHKAKTYLEKGLEVIGVPTNKKLDIRKRNIQNTLDFLKILHGIDLHVLNPQHPAERAFLYAKTNRVDDAIELLQRLKEDNGELTAVQSYYLGYSYMKKGSSKHAEIHFKESIEKFKKTSDFFYMKLPIEYKD